MTSFQSILEIDLGEVGFHNSKQPFKVRLDCGPLIDLVRATEDAYRVYELLLIDRPGDIWDYVWVILDKMPKRVAERVSHARQKAALSQTALPCPWPEDGIPFTVFDDLFFWAEDDTEPEDKAWLNHRDSALMRSFAQKALSLVYAAQSRLDWNDPLLRHIVARVRSAEHPYCYLDRDVARAKSWELPPNEPLHTPEFYKKLDDLLRDGNLTSVAYRSEGDHQVLRMMATEQRRRAELTGHAAGLALHLSSLVDQRISNAAWESEIWFFDEGLAHGDLFIEGGGLGGNLKALVEMRRVMPGRYILAARDEGSLAGFRKEEGGGWVLYRREHPDSRRVSLERIACRRIGKSKAVLSFGDSGGTLFDHEKSVIFVGTEVPNSARVALASTVAAWQYSGGNPLLVVIGDTTPFDQAGCNDVWKVPTEVEGEEAMARWLDALVQRSHPWIDVVMALHAPDWAKQVLADRSDQQDRPWPAWIVSNESGSALNPDLVLDGDLATALLKVNRHAQNNS